jgi:hypothetical protein
MHLKIFLKLKKTLKCSLLGKKTQKKPQKTKKPTGLVFLKKPGFFSNPVPAWYLIWREKERLEASSGDPDCTCARLVHFTPVIHAASCAQIIAETAPRDSV